MLGNNYDHGLIAKYVALFGTLFNDIKITRQTNKKGGTQTYAVPLGFGPRDKWLARDEADPDLNRPIAAQLPRMSFQIIETGYDGSRKLPTTLRRIQKQRAGDKNVYEGVYTPVPWTIQFELVIMSKTQEEVHRIFEQIVPYFTPTFTPSVQILDEMPDYILDVPITLESSELKDEYDGSFKERRVISWTLVFNMKAFLFGPVSEAKLIKIAKVNFFVDDNITTPEVTITVTPGMTANGQPTTDPAQTIPPLEISETDTYDYIVDIEENLNG